MKMKTSVYIIFNLVLLLTSALVSQETIFLQWLIDNGATVRNIGIDHFERMGRGIVSKSKISEGDLVFFIPKSLILCEDTVKSSTDEIHKKLSDLFPNADELIPAFLLLERYRGENSFWKPYLDVLPSYVPNINFFSIEELSELQNQVYADEILREQSRNIDKFDSFKNKTANLTPFISTNLTYEDYGWALSMVDSRAFRFHGRINLVPLADMFNYAPHATPRKPTNGQFFLLHHKLDSEGLSISADRNADKGTQLLEDYGDNGDNIYLQYHGFVPDRNPFRCVPVGDSWPMAQFSDYRFPDIDENRGKFLKELHFKKAPRTCVTAGGGLGQTLEVYLSALAFTNEEIKSCRKIMQKHKGVWVEILQKCGFNNASNALQAYQSYHTHTQSEGKSWLRPTYPTDSVEYRVLNLVRHLFLGMVLDYPTTLQEDTAIVNQLSSKIHAATVSDTSVSEQRHLYRLSNAVKYRLRLKELLHTLEDMYDPAPRTERSDGPLATTDASDAFQVTSRDDVTEQSLESAVEDFNQWFDAGIQAVGAVNLIKAAVIPGFRIGTVAVADISAEDIYLSVPLHMIMDVNIAQVDQNFGPFLQSLEKKFKRRDNFHELLMYLVYEYFVKGPQSTFWPYLHLLPKPTDMDIPLMWSEEQVVRRLAPSESMMISLEYQTRMRRTYESIMRVDLIKNFMSPAIFTFENYRWAAAILDSRSIWWSGQRHLVPMLDFVNCQENPPGTGRVHSTTLETLSSVGDVKEIVTKAEDGRDIREVPFENAVAVTRAARPFLKDEQVFEDYGQPNHIYFMYHGFVLVAPEHPNPYDCVHLEVLITPEEWSQLDSKVALDVINKLRMRPPEPSSPPEAYPSVDFCLQPKYNQSTVPEHVWTFLSLKRAGGRGEQQAYLESFVRSRLERYLKWTPSEHLGSNRFVESEKVILHNWLSDVEKTNANKSLQSAAEGEL